MSAPLRPAPVEVDPPAIERYGYGLLSAARMAPSGERRWEIASFTVTLTKAVDTDVLTATLTARDARYGTEPVVVRVDGVAKNLATIAATQTWDVVALSTVDVYASIGTTGAEDQCSAYTAFVVPATAATDTDTLECEVVLDPTQKAIPFGLDEIEARPFTVYDGLSCLSLTIDEARSRAERKLMLHEQYWVERRFALTTLREDVITVGGAAVPLLRGVGLLEDALAERYGGIGVLHAARELAPLFEHKSLNRREGGRMRSPLDNVWAYGAGYSTAGPDGVAAPEGQAWLYATGPVVVRRSEIQTREVFDQRNNTRVAISERSYVITADCPRLAVLVDIPEE